MTFPSRRDNNTSTTPSISTSHSVAMPATVVSGDLLLIFIMCGNNTLTTGYSAPGWDQEFHEDFAAIGTLGCLSKIADGSEGGTNVTVTSSQSRITAHCSTAIKDWKSKAAPRFEYAVATHSFAEPDPPSLTPTWGAADTLWLECAGNETGDGSFTLSTNYGGLVEVGTGGSQTTHAAIGLGSRQLNAASENPGAMAYGGSSDKGVSVTVGIEPAAAAATTITASLEAAVQAQKTLAASLDAGVARRLTRTTSLDGALAGLVTRAATLDAALAALQTAQATLDAAVEAAQQVTASLDAFLTGAAGATIGVDLDAALQARRTLLASLEAAVQRAALARTVSLDAMLARVVALPASLDAAIRTADVTALASLDAALQSGLGVSAALDAVIGTQASPAARRTYAVPGRGRCVVLPDGRTYVVPAGDRNAIH